MREFVNKYGVVVACVLIVLAALILWILRSPTQSVSNSKLSYYIDDLTGKESVQSSNEVPPLKDDKGELNVVEVVKISCDNGKHPRPAYYRKYAPDEQKRLAELAQMPPPTGPDDLRRRDMEKQRLDRSGLWIRKPDAGSPWVLAASQEGALILQAASDCPDKDQTAMRVFPQ